jgi:hypothetical protein
MAVTNNYGLTYADKNRIRRYHESGMNIAHIAAKLRCTVDLAGRYIRTLSKPRDVVPVEDTGGSDAFGPLPETPEWMALTPGEKGQISKRRNAA